MNLAPITNFSPRRITILATALAIATVIFHSTNHAAFADEQKASPLSVTFESKPTLSVGSKSQSADQLTAQIEVIEAKLKQLREEVKKNNSKGTQPAQELEKAAVEIANFADVLSRTDGASSPWFITGNKVDQEAQTQQYQQLKEQLAKREKEFAAVAKQLVERRQPLPPLENGTMKIYRLNFAQARDAAQTIESLFGQSALRLAVDERSNTLIAYSKPESVAPLDALLNRLDEQAAPAAGSEKAKQANAAASRSLLLRVFWLGDNLGSDVGQAPELFLPESVLRATHRLGLEAPRLITQTVNSLALGREETTEFSTSVPAVLFDRPATLYSQGQVKLVSDDRVRLQMNLHVSGPAINCELSGSLATPLGHYMVLGTANSVMGDGAAAMVGAPDGTGMVAPGAVAGSFGPGGGMVPGRAAGPRGNGPAGAEFGGPGAALPGGEAGSGGAQRAAKAKFDSSRFAFVVQIIDGQSYPAEKEAAEVK